MCDNSARIIYPYLTYYLASFCLKFDISVEVLLSTLLWIRMRLWLGGYVYAIIGGVLNTSPAHGPLAFVHAL